VFKGLMRLFLGSIVDRKT